MSDTVRRTVPARCGLAANYTAANGYRTCPDHMDVLHPGEALPRGSSYPCDYPMDGLGTARLAKETNK